MNSVSSHRPPVFSPCMFCQKEADYSFVPENHLLYPGPFCEACLDIFYQAIEYLHSAISLNRNCYRISSPPQIRNPRRR